MVVLNNHTATIRFDLLAGTAENLVTGQTANIGDVFGFYLISPDDGGVTFYTDDLLNPSQDEYGLIYDTYGYTTVITGDPDTVSAFEDVLDLGDQDYDDMVIGITNTKPSNP